MIIRDNRASNDSSVVQRSDGRLSLAGTDTLWGSSGIEITSTGRVAVGGTSFGRNDGSLIERFLVHGSAGITGSLHTSGSITTQANISGSITSTGSFGRVNFDGTGGHTFIQETANDVLKIIVGGEAKMEFDEGSENIFMQANNYNFRDASFNNSFKIEADNHLLSGSLTSTGSFGKLLGDGGDLTNVADPEAISGSYLGLLSGSHDLTLGLGASGSLLSTASFGVFKGDGSQLSNVSTETGSFASGSDLHQILAESSSYIVESETGSFASGSDIQIIKAESASYVVSTNTGSFVVNSQTSSFASGSDVQGVLDTYASGSDLHQFLAESASYVMSTSTGSFASGSDVSQIQAQTGSYASGSDLHTILAQSSSYLVNTDTGSLGLVTLGSDITGSITSTASFGDLVVADNTFISNNLSVGTDVIGQKLQVDGDVGFTGQLDVSGSVSGGLASTGSFGWVEILGTKVVDSNQTASFASGSDLHAILAESSSYMVSDQTGSMGTTEISDTLFVQGDITTSGSITAREFKTEFVSSSIIYASGSNQFGDTGDDVHEFSGSVKVGNLTFSTSSIGIQSDTDLISLSDDTFTLNGNIVIDDGANIGIDSDTDLLDLNDQNLIVNGVLDSTGRIDAQSGLQVSGSTLAVGNDLTLNYTSPVSHSLVYVNYTNKTVDLVPAASASGQLVQYNGSGWIITDEIDGGSF